MSARYKVAELEWAMLDAAVAKAEGFARVEVVKGACFATVPDHEYGDGNGLVSFSPTTCVDDADPIIHRERIAIWAGDSCWYATHPATLPSGYDGKCHYIDVNENDSSSGPEPRIAAMRAFVTHKLGREVEL